MIEHPKESVDLNFLKSHVLTLQLSVLTDPEI